MADPQDQCPNGCGPLVPAVPPDGQMYCDRCGYYTPPYPTPARAQEGNHVVISIERLAAEYDMTPEALRQFARLGALPDRHRLSRDLETHIRLALDVEAALAPAQPDTGPTERQS